MGSNTWFWIIKPRNKTKCKHDNNPTTKDTKPIYHEEDLCICNVGVYSSLSVLKWSKKILEVLREETDEGVGWIIRIESKVMAFCF